MGEKESEKEIECRRDAALLRALSTPHKRQKEMKMGRVRAVRPASAEGKTKRGK
jgi:hypothetical protein